MNNSVVLLRQLLFDMSCTNKLIVCIIRIESATEIDLNGSPKKCELSLEQRVHKFVMVW